MDMNAQTRNSLLTAMVCLALSSGTAWAATPELGAPAAAAQQQAASLASGSQGAAYRQSSSAALAKQPADSAVASGREQAASAQPMHKASSDDSRAVAEQAAQLRDMPLRWQAVPTTKELERAAKPQPVIITADDIKAQRKAERKKLAAESVKGQAQGQASGQVSQASSSQPQPVQQVQSLQASQPQKQPMAAQPLTQQAQPQKQPLQAVQPPKAQPVQSVPSVQPLQTSALMQTMPVQQPQHTQSAPQGKVMQTSSASSRQKVQADSEPGPLKQALQRLRAQDSAAAARPPRQAASAGRPGTAASPAYGTPKPQPQIKTAEDVRPQSVAQQPAQRPYGQQQAAVQQQAANRPEQSALYGQRSQLPQMPKQVQVERPPEFANVSDEVVRHILAGEFAMKYQLRQDPTEPGVYKLTQILNQNTGLTHLQKIEYLIGFGRAINRSNLTEWQKSALIKSVIEAFD